MLPEHARFYPCFPVRSGHWLGTVLMTFRGCSGGLQKIGYQPRFNLWSTTIPAATIIGDKRGQAALNERLFLLCGDRQDSR
jgi:hypothetical protein